MDDGLLTVSEVAQLKLNADWVVLSACNTAAGNKPGAEALSGLARAFFYAGARALRVAHWRAASCHARLFHCKCCARRSCITVDVSPATSASLTPLVAPSIEPWSASRTAWASCSRV